MNLKHLLISFLTVLIFTAVSICPTLSWANQIHTVVKLEITQNEKVPMGDIIIELYDDKAPITVDNFLTYVESGFYNGTIFHRVINQFMIQGGGFIPGLDQKKTNPPIKNEADNGLKNLKGTVAMARTLAIDSATSQFFINLEDNAFLDHAGNTSRSYGYAVFGRVISGMSLVNEIAQEKTTKFGRYQDVPINNYVIKSATVLEYGQQWKKTEPSQVPQEQSVSPSISQEEIPKQSTENITAAINSKTPTTNPNTNQMKEEQLSSANSDANQTKSLDSPIIELSTSPNQNTPTNEASTPTEVQQNTSATPQTEQESTDLSKDNAPTQSEKTENPQIPSQ